MDDTSFRTSRINTNIYSPEINIKNLNNKITATLPSENFQ
jgi:hypothetical protein